MNSEGIGLGLTICKQIVERSGGQIRVKSLGRNKGSIFMFNMLMESLTEPDNLVYRAEDDQPADAGATVEPRIKTPVPVHEQIEDDV